MLMNGQISSVNTGFPLTDTNTAFQSKKNENVPLFKDFLNNSSSKPNDIAGKNTVRNSELRRNEKTLASTADNNVKQKTFRELEKEMKVEARKAMIQGEKLAVEDYDTAGEAEEADKSISDSQKANLMQSCLAQVMGVNADELVMLLEAAGIKPEELASISQSDSLETRLAQAFGLDGEMGGTLGKILKSIEAQVEEALSMVLQDESTGKNQWVELDDMRLKAVFSKDNSSDTAAGKASVADVTALSGLMVKFKLKLKEMGDKLVQNEAALMDEIKLNIHPVLKNASAMLKISLNAVETVDLTDAAVGTGDSLEIDTASGEEANPSLSENEAGQTTDSEAIMPQFAAVKPETQQTSQAFGNVINQLQGNEPAANVDNVIMKAPVMDKEILSQVVEKAKVVLTADKSEMVMELKPESLGKLSLKVVTEHGMVMAKFVAESQQVKQVLETNMQLLKDSLEKQGLNVQGFSVSVRQESQNNHNDFNSHGDDRRRPSTVQMPGSGRMYADAAEIERLQRINPYRHEGNTVNFTA